MTHRRHVGFTLPPKLADKYQAMARADGRSFSGWIRQRLAEVAEAIEEKTDATS